MVGKTASLGDQIVKQAWFWVLNCKMRKCLTQGPLSLVGSPPIGGAKEMVHEVPALQGSTEETATGSRLSPSTGGGKSILTGLLPSVLAKREQFWWREEWGRLYKASQSKPYLALGCFQFCQAHICWAPTVSRTPCSFLRG